MYSVTVCICVFIHMCGHVYASSNAHVHAEGGLELTSEVFLMYIPLLSLTPELSSSVSLGSQPN